MIVEVDASEELLAAAGQYDDQREGLGTEFLSAIDDAIAGIADAPLSFPRDRFDERARRAPVSRFPYAVVFVVHDEAIRIVAFVHAKRLPGYWSRRV